MDKQNPEFSSLNVDNLQIRKYRDSDQEQIIILWECCGLIVPWNDPERDLQRKMDFQPDLLLVGMLEDVVVATVMVGYDGHRGWVNYLAVAPEFRKGGIGRRLMAEAEARLRALGCPKINLLVRTSNQGVIEFYQRIGFQMDEVVSMGKRLVKDD